MSKGLTWSFEAIKMKLQVPFVQLKSNISKNNKKNMYLLKNRMEQKKQKTHISTLKGWH